MLKTSQTLQQLVTAKVAIVGLGITGMSMLRFLLTNNIVPTVYDSRETPPINAQHGELLGQVTSHFGAMDSKSLADFDVILLSPGISLKEPAIEYAIQSGIDVFCDIELFARVNTKPVIAVTGSNGKSTVVAWLTDFINKIGKRAVVCGNFGVPVLDVIDQDVDVFVLELSSFQLDTTSSLMCEAATVLNVSPDHLDRYDSYELYGASKRRIYKNAATCLFNADDLLTKPIPEQFNNKQHSTLVNKKPQLQSFGFYSERRPATWSFEPNSQTLYYQQEAIANFSTFMLKGNHNALNALSVMALATAVGIKVKHAIAELASFEGLAHRCQLIENWNDVRFIDDSKATNIGSTIAAVSGLAINKNIVLIAGGDAKGADLSELTPVLKEHVKQVVALGKDKEQFSTFVPATGLTFVNSIAEAVKEAALHAQAGDIILLSPACASIDMFQNYQARAAAFISAVSSLKKGEL